MPAKPVTMDNITQEQKEAYMEGARVLKGGYRRQFMARIVNALGYGGAVWAARELGWNRNSIIKGQEELEAGVAPTFNPGGPGRPRAEDRLPNLLTDLRAIVDAQSQTDATFKTTQLYTRISARAVRQALIDSYGYSEEAVPCNDTIRVKLNQLGYKLRAVQKSRPKKKTRNRRHL